MYPNILILYIDIHVKRLIHDWLNYRKYLLSELQVRPEKKQVGIHEFAHKMCKSRGEHFLCFNER